MDRTPAPQLTPLQRDLGQARAAQARYDMPGFFALVRDCRELALTKHKMRPAKICDDAMFGAAQRLGDARAMVEADYWWQQHGFSGAEKASKVYGAFENADLAHLVGTVPAFSSEIVDNSSTLRYRHRIEFAGRVEAEPLASHRPTVTATINGKPVAVVVDTGTALPLVMDQTHAAALGATPLLGGWVAPGMGKHVMPGAEAFDTDVIASFKLGGLVMHNLAATVVPDGTFHVGVLVGLPVLARFGRVDLNDARIATGLPMPPCANSLPLQFVGAGQLGFPILANSRPAVAFIDTGNMNALMIKPQTKSGASNGTLTSLSELPKLMDVHHRTKIQIGAWSVTEVNVQDSEHPMDAKHALPTGVDVNIGAPLLAFADVQMDFSSPSVCVTPKPAVKDGAMIIFRDRQEDALAKSPIGVLLRYLDRALIKISSPAGTHGANTAKRTQ